MKKPQLKKVFNLLFLVAVFGLTFWSVFNGVDLNQVITYVKTAELGYILAGVACVVLYVMGEATIIHYLLGTLDTKVSLWRCCLISFTGFFYSCITPGAGGGQPMQVLALRKVHVPVAVSTVVLSIITLTFKLVLVLFGLVVVILRPESLMVYLRPVEFWIYAGLVLNIIWIVGLLLLIFHPALVRKLAYGLFAVLKKLHLIRDPERMPRRIENALSQYQGTAVFFKGRLAVIVNALVMTFVQRCILFFVTWLVYCSFGLEETGSSSMPLIVSLQAMISVASDMLPLPGGMGASETLFVEIFTPLFGQSLVLPGMVLSRGISYYTQLLICGMMTVVSSLMLGDKRKIGDKRKKGRD